MNAPSPLHPLELTLILHLASAAERVNRYSDSDLAELKVLAALATAHFGADVPPLTAPALSVVGEAA